MTDDMDTARTLGTLSAHMTHLAIKLESALEVHGECVPSASLLAMLRVADDARVAYQEWLERPLRAGTNEGR